MNRLPKVTAVLATLLAVGAVGLTGCSTSASVHPPVKVNENAAAASGGLPWEDFQEVFESAFEAFDAIEQCLDNEEKGIPCTQTTGETVNEIYSMLTAFIEEYRVDAYNTRNSLNTIISNQNKQALTAQWHQVDDDLGQGQTMFQIYVSWLGCSQAFSQKQPTCQAANVDGMTSTAPANQQTIDGLADLLVRINQQDPKVSVYWKHPWKTLLPLVSGNVTNPYVSSDSSLLHDMYVYMAGSEAQRQGLDADADLVFYPASFVNAIGSAVTELINLESMYAVARIAAYSIQAKQETPSGSPAVGPASPAMSIATDMYIQLTGRDPNTGEPVTPQQVIVPTLANQLAAFTFPGWSTQNQLADNQAYVSGPKSKPVLLTYQGNSTTAPADTSALPTDAQLAAISADIGNQWSISTQKIKPGNSFKGQYDFLSSVYPKVLVPRTTASAPADTSVGRWWSAPQQIWLTTEGNSWSVRQNSGDPYHPFYYLYPGHVGKDGITGQSDGTRSPVTVLATGMTSGGKAMQPAAPMDSNVWRQQALPYNIYPKSTDTQGKSGFYSSNGAAPLTVAGTPFSAYATALPTKKSDTSSALVQPGTKYPAGFSSPVWDVFSISNAGPGKTTSLKDANTSQSFGPGLLVQANLESANVTVKSVAPSGALQAVN